MVSTGDPSRSPVVERVATTDPEALISGGTDSNVARRAAGSRPVESEPCVLLRGDAVHAMTPNLAQRSGQAMEVAVILVGAIVWLRLAADDR
jgi:2-polyprenyl-6-methoxyphenol hydroxylase-like FAD-dependent oxidoreductase